MGATNDCMRYVTGCCYGTCGTSPYNWLSHALFAQGDGGSNCIFGTPCLQPRTASCGILKRISSPTSIAKAIFGSKATGNAADISIWGYTTDLTIWCRNLDFT